MGIVSPMKIKRIIKWGFLFAVIATGSLVFIAYWRSTNDCEQYSPGPAASNESDRLL